MDQQFIDHAYLTYIVPFATNFKLEQALGQGDEPNRSLFDSIEQRESLFFGMRFALLPCAPLPSANCRPQMRSLTST